MNPRSETAQGNVRRWIVCMVKRGKEAETVKRMNVAAARVEAPKCVV